jgi:hypothetical protein
MTPRMPRNRPSEPADPADPADLLDSIRALGRLAAADVAPDLRVAERLKQIVDNAGLGHPEEEPVGLEHRD